MGHQPAWHLVDTVEDACREIDFLEYSDPAELARVPQRVLDLCWTALEQSWDRQIAKALRLSLSMVTDKVDHRAGALQLKRLFEIAVSHDHVAAKEVAVAITSLPFRRLGECRARLGIPRSAMTVNPMSVIERCFYEGTPNVEDYLTGAFLFVGHRMAALLTEPTRFVACVYAAREAYGFFSAGEAETAWASLDFCGPYLQSVECDLQPEQSEVLGRAIYAAATAVPRRKDGQRKLLWLGEGQRLMQARGDKYAGCLCQAALVHDDLGNIAEAFRLFGDVLQVPDVEDQEPIRLAEMGIARIRAAYGADPSKSIAVQPLATGRTPPDDYFPLLAKIEECAMRGEQAPDDLLLQASGAALRFAEWLEGKPGKESEAFKQLLTGLKFLMSMERTEGFSDWTAMLRGLDRHLEHAETGDQVQYSAIRSTLERMGLAASGARPHCAGADALRTIESLPNAESAIDALITLSGTYLFGAGMAEAENRHCELVVLENLEQFDWFRRVFALAVDRLVQLRSTVRTGRSAYAHRLFVGHLHYQLNAALFLGYGIITLGEVGNDRIHRVDRVSARPGEWEMLQAYDRFLGEMGSWTLEYYRGESSGAILDHLNQHERTNWAELQDRLAESLWQTRKQGPGCLANVMTQRTIDRMRELRLIAELSSRSPSECRVPGGAVSPAPAEDARPRLHVFELNPRKLQNVAGIVFGTDAVVLCNWGASAGVLHRCSTKLRDSQGLGPDADQALSDVLTAETMSLERSVLGGRSIADDGTIDLYDHAHLHVPFARVMDPNGSRLVTAGRGRAGKRATRRDGTISFWGQVKYRSRYDDDVDDTQRLRLSSGEVVMRYPHPPERRVRRPGTPPPLVYSCYEKWLLQDLGCEAGRLVETHTGQDASRAAFLYHNWSSVSVLHVSTHGEVHEDVLEFAHLLFAERDDQPECVHASEIMGMDWSSVDVVFLNACLTLAGEKHLGENPLSLAWAFLAGGARAVIASRWAVEDEAAWCFAQHFYGHWLANAGVSTQEAFRDALRATKQRFSRPTQWCTFELLEN